MNLPTADKIRQTGATCLRKTSAMKFHGTAMIHSVEIALLCWSFKRLRLEGEQIIWILLDLEQTDLWHKFHIRKAVFKACGTRMLWTTTCRSSWPNEGRAQYLKTQKNITDKSAIVFEKCNHITIGKVWHGRDAALLAIKSRWAFVLRAKF